MKRNRKSKETNTRQFLRVPFVDVDISDDVELDFSATDLPLQIVKYELIISWVEAEARWPGVVVVGRGQPQELH